MKMENTPKAKLNLCYSLPKSLNNFIEYQEYYILRNNLIFKFIIENNGNEIMI